MGIVMNFRKWWNRDRFESSVAVMQSRANWPVGARLVFRSSRANSLCLPDWLNRRKSARLFEEIFCDDISEFESSQPSQPVPSLQAMSGSQK